MRATFERFTERARQVVVLAKEEARTMRHQHIDVEHLLIGVLREEEGLGARALERVGVTLEAIRLYADESNEPADVVPDLLPFSPAARGVLESSLGEALALGHNYIGTEHILLAITSAATLALPGGVRDAVAALLGKPSPSPAVQRPGVKDSLEAIRSTLEAMRRSDAAQPVIQLPDWVWGILINDQIDRAKARRLVIDTVRALHVRQGDGSPFEGAVLNDLVESVLTDNPDVADA